MGIEITYNAMSIPIDLSCENAAREKSLCGVFVLVKVVSNLLYETPPTEDSILSRVDEAPDS